MQLQYQDKDDRIYVFEDKQERELQLIHLKLMAEETPGVAFRVKKDGQEGTMVIIHSAFSEIAGDHQACMDKASEILGAFFDGYTLA